METNRAEQIIVTVLQNALIGKLDLTAHFNPQDAAKAIIAKVIFEKSYGNLKSDQIVGSIVETIVANKIIMAKELKELAEDKKLLANFIKGKLTAYEEILETLNFIK